MLTFHAIGDWGPGRVRLARSAGASARRIVPDVERVIDVTWARESARPGVRLFDGPMCRLDSFEASPAKLELAVSPTSYKAFAGTNLHNPHLAETFGRDVMANPVGASTLLETGEGLLLLGHRNASVAYYPNRVHPFAGTIDPADGDDPFAAARRELLEELNMPGDDITAIRCAGLVEDAALLQPELIFVAGTTRTREHVVRRLDAAEHRATFALAGREDAVASASRDPLMTPVAVASLLLWGRSRFGLAWFERNAEGAGTRAG